MLDYYAMSTNDKLLVQQLGKVIRKLRKQKNLSQEEFAHQCGLHRTYVGAIERGEKAMTIVTVAKFAHALEISLSRLFLELEEEFVEDHDHN